MTRILLLTRDLRTGGAERFLVRLANQLVAQSVQVKVAVMQQLSQDESYALRCPVEYSPHPINSPLTLIWLGRLMLASQVTVSFVLRADQSAALVARLTGYKGLMVTERGGRVQRLDRGWKRELKRLGDRLFTYPGCQLAVSNSLAGVAALREEGLDHRKIRHIPSGLILPSHPPAAKPQRARLNFGYLGRLVSYKKVDTILRALAASTGKATLEIAGEGPERSRLEALTRDLGLTERVTFLGACRPDQDFFDTIDTGIIASETEGMPSVLLEYWRSGTPVLLSDIEPLRALARAGQEAVFFRVDDHQQLAQRMDELSEQPQLRSALASAGFQHFQERYDIAKVTHSYRELFQEITIPKSTWPKRIRGKFEHAVRLGILHLWARIQPYVLVTEYPRSGGTWLGQMLAEALHLPFPRHRLPSLKGCLLHGHYRPAQGMRHLRKILWLKRDGRDVMVSLYHHMLLWNEGNRHHPHDVLRHRANLGFRDYHNVRKNLPEFIRYLHQYRPSRLVHFTYYGTWAEFNRAWSEFSHRHPDLVIPVRYESLLQNPTGELGQILDQGFGIAFDGEELGRLVDKFSFAKQSGRQPGQENKDSFLRKGVAGCWRNDFSESALKAFEQYAGQEMVRQGYD